MSFWNKNKLPAEYKDLSEDEIAALLAKGKTAEAEALTQKTAAESATADKTRLETEAAELRRKLEARPEPEPNKDQNQNRNEPSGPPDAAAWLTDPNAAFNASITPVAAIALHAGIGMAKMQADNFIRQQGPVEARLWAKYSGEVEKIVNNLSPDQRILPQTWINQFTFIKGMHLSEVVKEGQAAGDAFFSESAHSTGRGMPENSNTNNDTLTAAEEAVAKKLGRSSADYLKQKRAMQFGTALH